MKQTKWQRLATIGLCSSLVINAFSGVTAVAETITIESSPTVASSAKEATSASSATPESTESSQETTETSREEVTQETVEQEDTTEIAQEENLLEPSGIQAKIMPRAFVWAATGTTNRTTVRLNDVVDYRMKLENITTDDTNSDIVGPIRIESKLAAGMTRPTSVIIKVGPEEQNVVIGEGSHNANSGGEYFVWTESTRTVTAFINRLHGRTSGNTGYIKTLYFQTRITSGTHNEKKYIDSTIRFNGFGAVNRRNEMTYVDRFSGNLGLKGNLKFYDEDGVASKEQMSLSINPVLFKSTNSRVEGTLLRYPLTMTNAGSGLYRFDTGLKNIGTSNGGSWFFFSNDIVINFATATTNRIDKIVLAPPKATLPDSRKGVMTSRAYTSTTYTRSNYDISTYNFTKATGKTWRITNRSSNSGVSTNIMFSDNLVGTTGQFNKGNSGATINYYIYYKKLYENFVNSNGQKITPPSGFTQGKRTVINSEAYTFKQSGTLPDTYQADGETYKFKGWYKGKTKPNTLTATKAPSYAVTYDDNDDLNVVYEEVVPRDTWVYPGFYAEFVDEQGKAFTNPLTFSGNYTQFLRKKTVNIFETTGNLYPMIGSKDPSQSNKYKIETQSRIPISATYDGNVTGDVYDKREYGLHDLTITNELKYVDKIEVMNTSLQAADYLVGYVGIDPILIDFPNILHPLERAFIKNTNQRFSINAIFGANGSASTIPRLLRIGGKDQPNQRNVTLMGFDGTTNYKHTMNYKVTRKQVTENFVDTNGTKITPPTGFTQNKKTPMTSNNYTFKQAGTLPDTYTTGGKTYKFKGWYKGKTKPNTLTTTKAPSYAVTYDDNDDLNVVYEEETVTTLYPSINMNFVNEKGGTFTPALTFSGKYYAQSTSASLRTDLYDVTSKNNGSGQYTVSINNGSMPLSQDLLKKYNNGQPISATNRLRFNVDKLTINQQLKYVDTIQVDTAQSSSLNYYGHKYTSGSSTIFDPNIAPTEYNMTTEQINSLNFSSDGTYFSNANNRFFNMHLGYSSSGGSSLLMMALFNENPVNQTKLVYKVTRKQVTETFVNTNGTKITPPTGFTQGNKIPMTSNTFKYTAAKALPATYTAGGKTYTFQGWYKGKTKPNTLTTSTTPTYNTTFDGNDDMTAMYKEVTAVYPGFYAQFVDEQGKAFTNPLTLSGNYTEFLRKTGTTVFETKGAFYPMVGKRDTTVTNKYKIETTSSVAVPNNYWTAMPADIANRGYALNNLDITNQMKYVDKIETTDTHTTMYDYTGVSDIGGKPNNTSQTELNPIDKTFVKQTDNTFAIKSIWGNGTFSHIVPKMLLLAESGSFSRLFGFDGTPDYKQTVNYKVTRKQVTETFVNTNGTKITPPTGFTQGNKIPMTSNTFKYTAAKALPATYTAGGKTYTFQGWYKGKTKPNTLTTSTTPTYNTTFDGNDDMTAMYKEEVPKASVALTRTTAETVTSGGNVTWRATITNTSQAPLTTATIKKSTAWTTGLAAPTAMIVTPAGGTAKTVPVTATTWTNGVSLGTDIPVGKSATVQFTTKATGTAGQVLRAGITTSGNYSGVSASATVRVKDNDQAIVTPTAEGFISVPTFNFGQVGVAGSTQQHGLKKAADYYGNGTRNPYLRIKKTQPNWSLTAQLSQPKSATDSLPTATRLLLGAAPVSSFSNYNQPTELKNAVGTTSAISLNANNTATRIIANQQFTGSNIYQLDFTFNNVKLEVPANQGVKGQQYQAAITWNLVTGP